MNRLFWNKPGNRSVISTGAQAVFRLAVSTAGALNRARATGLQRRRTKCALALLFLFIPLQAT